MSYAASPDQEAAPGRVVGRTDDYAVRLCAHANAISTSPDSSCFPTHPPMNGQFKPVLVASVVHTRRVKLHSSWWTCRVRRLPGQESPNVHSFAQTNPAHGESGLVWRNFVFS